MDADAVFADTSKVIPFISRHFPAVYISPILSAAFSATPISRGIYTDRPFGGTTEEARSSKTAAASAVDAASAIFGPQQTQSVPQTESISKSPERQQKQRDDHSGSKFPEKSTDSDKQRSRSGDILDLSAAKETEKQKTGQAEKSENSAKSGELTPEEKAQVEKLKARDAEVRTHEAAHLAAAGQYAQGGPQFEYQTGPDGKKYAIGGSVSIDISPVAGDPEATIQKARQVRAAALAPAEPSGQDQNVAAAASQMEADARLQLARERTEGKTDESKSGLYTATSAKEVDEKDAEKPLNSRQSAQIHTQKKLGAGAAAAYLQNQAAFSGPKSFVAYA